MKTPTMCTKTACTKKNCGCTCKNCLPARRDRQNQSLKHCQRHDKNCHWN